MELKPVDELEWSDEEDSDEKYTMKLVDVPTIDSDYFIGSEFIVDQTALIEPDLKLNDHKRSYFSGNVKLKAMTEAVKVIKTDRKELQFNKNEKFKFTRKLTCPLPKIPELTYQIIEKNIVLLIWSEFLNHGSDESELIKVSQITKIDKQVAKELGYSLPLMQVSCLTKLEHDDYAEFLDILSDLVEIVAKTPLRSEEITLCTYEMPLPCCTYQSCKHHSVQSNQLALLNITGEERKEQHSDLWDDSTLFRLNIIYKQIQHDENGKLRIKHIFSMCTQLGIAYSKQQLPQTVLMNQTECLIKNQEEAMKWIDMVSCVVFVCVCRQFGSRGLISGTLNIGFILFD